MSRTSRLRPNAVRAYRAALTHHVLPALGALELEDVTTAVIRGWLCSSSWGTRPIN